MVDRTNYWPLSSYFGWSLVAIGIWQLGWYVARSAGAMPPAADVLPPEYQVSRFVLRLLASDFQCGMTVLFLGAILYACAQFAAVAQDQALMDAIFADRVRKAPWCSTGLAVCAGRQGTVWNELTAGLSNESSAPSSAEMASALSGHVRFGGEASMMPLRFALWLFPMLGFLGTVIGLSFAVNDLSSIVTSDTGGGLRDPKFKDVLGNLHLAFDTTIQGISFAIVVILLLAALDRVWQRFAHRVEILEVMTSRAREPKLLTPSS